MSDLNPHGWSPGNAAYRMESAMDHGRDSHPQGQGGVGGRKDISESF